MWRCALDTKRYIGSDLRRLFARIERELGPDAMVVRTRTLLREGGDPLIEVIAAPGGEDGFGLELERAVTESLLQRVVQIEPQLTLGELEDLLAREGAHLPDPDDGASEDRPATTVEERGMAEDAEPGAAEPPQPAFVPLRSEPPARWAWEEELLRAGLSPTAVAVVGELAPSAPSPASALATALRRLLARFPSEEEQAAIAVIGAPGTGRTTALVRMAIDCLDAGRPAVLVAADHERAAATELLHAYGEALGVEVIEEDGDWRALCRALGRAPAGTCFFIDLPSEAWQQRPPGLAAYGYVAVPRTFQARALEVLVAPYIDEATAGAILTFADADTELTPALSFVIGRQLGLAFLSCGRDIARGITEVDPFALASGVLPEKTGELSNGRLSATA